MAGERQWTGRSGHCAHHDAQPRAPAQGTRRCGPNIDPDYAEDPPSAVGTQGSWVVSQRYHRPRVTVVSLSLPGTTFPFPTLALAYNSEGAPVTVSPAEWEGGVLNPPTPWLPHGN